jgi:hypothetical protein
MIADTAIVDYRLYFANYGKRTSVFRFCLQQTYGSLPFPFAENKRKLPFSDSYRFPLVQFSVSSIFR